MADLEAKTAAYESTLRRHERRIRQAMENLREALDKAERRMASTDELDRQLLSSSGTEVAQQAGAFAEAAAAWSALREVSYLTKAD